MASIYSAIKHSHMLLAAISIILFLLRGALALQQLPWRSRFPVLRWLPHANDTLLLLTAISLAVISHQYPISHHWLTAKVIMLLVYILAGKAALKPNLNTQQRILRLGFAITCFATIVAIAITHSATLGL